MAAIAVGGLPEDCMDIHHHTKNVSMGFITNDTEKYIDNIYTRLVSAVPEWGEPSSIEWGGTTGDDVHFTIEWE